MKHLAILSIILISIASSCKSAPEGFCECLEKGEELNAKTQEVLSGRASEETKRKMLKIRKEKKKMCAQFENASGPQMREWKKACED